MDLVFERRGKGESLVLLHGLGSRWQAFEPVLDLLAGDFAVHAVDMPGFGASAALPGRTTVADLTDSIAAWMASRSLTGCHVAGHSTGGGVALELADRGLVATATALAPIGFWSARERAYGQRSLSATRAISRLSRPLAPAIARSAVARTLTLSQIVARPWRLAPDVVVGDIDALIGAPAFDDVCASFTGYLAPATAADRVPVTIAWGDRDRLLLSRQANRARRRLPRARHVLVHGAGHLMMADEPAAVADVIRAGTRAPTPNVA